MKLAFAMASIPILTEVLGTDSTTEWVKAVANSWKTTATTANGNVGITAPLPECLGIGGQLDEYVSAGETYYSASIQNTCEYVNMNFPSCDAQCAGPAACQVGGTGSSILLMRVGLFFRYSRCSFE